jgi:broad specificity phosphatase PhoE
MKPKLIFLFRHGQSEGNVSKDIYATKPDYALELTDWGKQQALAAGEKMATVMEQHGIDRVNPIQFYISPFWRTRQTYIQISKTFPNRHFYEDPRLREQEWGHLRDDSLTKKLEEYRDNYGHFYYRFNDGESCADVYDRISTFLETLFRDFKKDDFPEVAAIVSHGMTLRVLLMRWFHLSVEEFELLANPANAEFHVLKLNTDGKYDLITTPRKRPVEHGYQFEWQ